MSLDMNDAAEQKKMGELIEDGTFVKLQLAIKPGGETLPGQDPIDNGLFRRSTTSDAMMIDCEFTVLEPPQYAHRKIFELWTVAGGEVDEKGVSKAWNITKSRLRAMVESATGTDPKDQTPQANANRRVQGFRSLDNCPFWAKLMIEAGGENKTQPGRYYQDKNRIDYICTPAEPEYAVMRSGGAWPAPKPRNSRGPAVSAGGRAAAPAAGPKPAWQQPAPAQATLPGTTPAAPAQPAAKKPAWVTG